MQSERVPQHQPPQWHLSLGGTALQCYPNAPWFRWARATADYRNPVEYDPAGGFCKLDVPAYTRRQAVYDFRDRMFRGCGDVDLDLFMNQVPDPTLTGRGPAVDGTGEWLSDWRGDVTAWEGQNWRRPWPA